VLVIESPDEKFNTTVHRHSLGELDYVVDRRNGDVRYGRAGELLFVDQGSKISLFQENEAACVAALQLGQAKFGSRLHVTGSAASKKAFALAAAKHNLRVEFTDSQMNDWIREARAAVGVPSPAVGTRNVIPAQRQPHEEATETGRERKRREAAEAALRKELRISPLVQMSKVGQGLSPDAIRQDMNVAREGLFAGMDAHALGKQIADMRGLKEDRIYAFDLVRSVQHQIRSELELALGMQRSIER
jgi:hypothetical protein